MYQEQTGGQVIIKKLANGYLVTLPVAEQNHILQAYQAIPGIVRKTTQSDPLLEELKGEGEEQTDEQQYEMAVCTNQFVFKSFTAVLNFLREKMTGESQE